MSIDPKLQYCTYCQHTWKPKLYHKIIRSYTERHNTSDVSKPIPFERAAKVND